MATESIERMVFVAVEVVILIIGVVFLLQISSGMAKAANEESSFASAEKLRSAINEACIRNIEDPDKAIEVELKLTQSIPKNILTDELFEDFTGRFFLKTSGDEPSYILYYEMFPPGEAIGWEAYHDIGYRAIGMLDYGANYYTAGNFISSLQSYAISAAVGKPADKPLTAFIGNVQPGSFNPTTGQEAKKAYDEFFGIGEWELHPGEESGNFIFDNYAALSVINKTIMKYLPCGENSLCLKTTEGIYSFPLDYCDNIKYVQLINPKEDVEAKYADFYLASPCIVTAKVYIADCSKDLSYWSWTKGLENEGGCDRSTTYPMYSYNPETGQFKEIGEHTTCLDIISDEGDSDQKEIKQCIRVELTDKEGFCYTRNLKKDWYDWLDSPVGTWFAHSPITASTQYSTDNYFILKSIEMPGFWSKASFGEIWIWP